MAASARAMSGASSRTQASAISSPKAMNNTMALNRSGLASARQASHSRASPSTASNAHDNRLIAAMA